ncbi:CDP-diacylglycerol--glycerol-3-phosphate 3-phosphatidyltransferase [Marispirochaeta aestuarii]|uniref:CDP-diacylglycerol--glycerol-3-phosphate 3-phosphatidyltransferase n=1 Tax=Marispirochaeta aestuarii TaxID=1963862 RepID=UPI0029C90924|nr:CDP-diacylglycerol--glycerol-3-phosphate 3-phosphatidyltransferase [Marispirochaeta aestuarii]
MNLPNKLTVLRIVITPLFLLFFLVPDWISAMTLPGTIIVWLLYLLIESSDVLDGYIARKYNLVSDLGKVLDPFADVLSRITYFICFTAAGIMPVVILAVLLYREFSITFLRMVLIRKGVAMAASVWGKLKAVTYAIAGVLGLVTVSAFRLNLFSSYLHLFERVTLAVFIMAAVASVASFITYLKAAVPVLRDSFQE